MENIPNEIRDDTKLWIIHTMTYDERVISFIKKKVLRTTFVRTRVFENKKKVYAIYTLKPPIGERNEN